jgi:outer membrane protein TolC
LQQKSLQNSDFDAEKMTHPAVINDFNTSLQVMQPIYNADAAIGRKIAVTAKNAEEQMAVRTEETIGFQVSKVYYGLILARKNIEAVEQSIKTMQAHSNEAAKAFNAGLMTKSDKLSTEVRLSELQEQKLMLHDAIKDATDALKVMLHLDSQVAIVPTGDLVVDGVMPGGENKTESEHRADLKALEISRQIAGYQADMARAARLPRVNAFFQSNLHSDNIFSGGSSWGLGMNVQWNIFDGMSSAGRIQEAKAHEREAMFNYETARSNSTAEVDKSIRSMRTAKARIAVAQKSIAESKVSLDYIGSQYKTGMAMTFELLMREQAYTYAKMRLNQAKYDFCVAKSELAYYRGN